MDLKLRNKLHGPMYSKIGVMRLYNGHVIFVITRQSNPPISTFSKPRNKFTSVWSMFPCNLLYKCFFYIVGVKNYVGRWLWARVCLNPILDALSVIRPTILITIVEQGQVPFTL